jgi:hypothetical protein
VSRRDLRWALASLGVHMGEADFKVFVTAAYGDDAGRTGKLELQRVIDLLDGPRDPPKPPVHPRAVPTPASVPAAPEDPPAAPPAEELAAAEPVPSVHLLPNNSERVRSIMGPAQPAAAWRQAKRDESRKVTSAAGAGG